MLLTDAEELPVHMDHGIGWKRYVGGLTTKTTLSPRCTYMRILT